MAATSPGYSANPHRRFEVLKPLSPLAQPAKWAILVYMAGDDRNPRGIEYAISQDLMEMKQVGSTDSVHFIVQTDDATGNASYRYRLLKGTDLAADRIERFNGELNTGSTKTLVDFVKWAHHLFPAERNALVLWGHGSGHDDQDVYRTARGSVSPRTAARLAQRRLGFFSGTRRAILEQGPTRGYGYDDTSRDFLDNAELREGPAANKRDPRPKDRYPGVRRLSHGHDRNCVPDPRSRQHPRGERKDRARRRLVVQPCFPGSSHSSRNNAP